MGNYFRVKIKTSGKKTSSFWAQKLKKTKLFTIYRKVNNEGDDFGHYNRKNVLVDKQHLISNSLIISEKPAAISKIYGTMVVWKKGKRGHPDKPL